jgi:hypothetical protein
VFCFVDYLTIYLKKRFCCNNVGLGKLPGDICMSIVRPAIVYVTDDWLAIALMSCTFEIPSGLSIHLAS